MNERVDIGNRRSSAPIGCERPREEFFTGKPVESEGRDFRNHGYANRES